MAATHRPGPLAVLGVAETAVTALCEQQLRASLGQRGSVDAIGAAVEASAHWAAFAGAALRGEITEHHPDLPRSAQCGPLGELVVLWARQSGEAAQ